MDTILTTLEYRYNILKNAIRTGNFKDVIHEIKTHFISNKNTYIVLTFLVVLYTLYEKEYTNKCDLKISYRIRHITQSGGDTQKELDANTSPTSEEGNTTARKSGISSDIDINSSKGKKTADNKKTSQLAHGAHGLCDGEGTIAKLCRGGKDGVANYFKFFGYFILAGLAILSPFVIYIVLVYMMLKIMFTGLKNI